MTFCLKSDRLLGLLAWGADEQRGASFILTDDGSLATHLLPFLDTSELHTLKKTPGLRQTSAVLASPDLHNGLRAATSTQNLIQNTSQSSMLPSLGPATSGQLVSRSPASSEHSQGFYANAQPGPARQTVDTVVQPTAHLHLSCTNRKRLRGDLTEKANPVVNPVLALADAAKFPQGSIEQPYNAGFFQETASNYGIESTHLFQRLVRSLREGNSQLIQGLFGKGGSPLRLFGARGEWLKKQLQATLMHQLPPQEVMRHLNTMMVFDGVHLTLSGFAAAAVASDAHTYDASVPSGKPILTEPSSASASGVDSSSSTGSAMSSEGEDAGHASDSASRNTAFQYDPRDGINASRCSLASLFSRWPHLLRLLKEQGSALVDAAQRFLVADAEGKSIDPDQVLTQAYYQHLQNTQTCAGMWVHRAEGSYMQNVGLTSKIMNLLGFDLAALTDYVLCDSDTLSGRSVHWIHPSCVGRRAAAALDASVRGVDAYSFEGLFLRMIGGEAGAARSAAAAGDVGTQVQYSPFYAVQTCHNEYYPNGKRRMEVIYLSDVVHARACMLRQEGLHIAKTEVDALCSLMQAHATHAPAAALRRQSGNIMEFAMQFMSVLDAESQVRLLKRLGMLAARHKDPLLLRSLPPADAASATASSAAAAAGPADAPAQPLQSLAGLDWATLDAAHGNMRQSFGEQGLQALAQGVMSTSQQPPKEAVCLFGEHELKAPFPFSSIRDQNLRWQ